MDCLLSSAQNSFKFLALIYIVDLYILLPCPLQRKPSTLFSFSVFLLCLLAISLFVSKWCNSMGSKSTITLLNFYEKSFLKTLLNSQFSLREPAKINAVLYSQCLCVCIGIPIPLSVPQKLLSLFLQRRSASHCMGSSVPKSHSYS